MRKDKLHICVVICFWCEKPRGDLMMIEDLDPTGFADYEPCKECKKLWEGGFVVLEGSSTPIFEGQPPTSQDPIVYPTGQWVLVSRESAIPTFGEEVVAKGRGTVDQFHFDKFFPWMKEEGKGH